MEQPNMMGGGMPNMMNQGMQRPQSGNIQQQLHARIISDLRQSGPAFNGTWQVTHDVRDRAQRIMQLVTQLRNLNSDVNTCLNIAQKWELRTFQEAQNKDDYVQRMDMKLKEIHGRRQQSVQNLPLGAQNPGMMPPGGQMGNANMMRPGGMMAGLPNMPNNAMNNMGNMNMNFQNGAMGMQSNQMNAGNPMFPAQLQRPMQASPVNLQNQQGTLDPSALMQQPQQNNAAQMPQHMGLQNQQQAPNMGQPRPPANIQQQIHARAKQMYDSMPDDQKAMYRQRFLSQMNPVQRQQFQATLGGADPLMRFCLTKARDAVQRNLQQQQQKPGQQMPNNLMQMGNNMSQRPPSQTNGQNIDFSAILGQQASAVKSADAGSEVVPASNNNNNNANMGIGNQMSMPQNINPQMLGNQGGQAGQGSQGNNAFNPQHLMAQQGAQERERLQKQQMATQHALATMQQRAAAGRGNQLQGQPGGLHTPNAFNGGAGGQANSPAMSMLNRPMVPPGQTTPGTPQPNRQQQHTPMTPMTNANQQLLQHHQNMLNQNNQQQQQQQQIGQGQGNMTQQQLRQLLEKVPEPLRQRLQGMAPEQVKQVLEKFKNGGFGNNPSGQAFQPGQIGRPGQLGQNMPNNMMGSQNQIPPQIPNFNMQPQANPNQQNGPLNSDPQAAARQAQQQTIMKMRYQIMDAKPFPRQIAMALGLTIPATINTWMQLKQHIQQNTAVVPQGTAQKLMMMQRQWLKENEDLINGEVQRFLQQHRLQQQSQQQQAQQNNAGQVQMSMPNQQAPAAQMVPPAPMMPPSQAGMAMPQNLMIPTAEDVNVFRQKIPQAAGMSDDEIKRAIAKRRMENWRQRVQAQQQQQGQQQQFPGQPPQPQRPNQPNLPNGTQPPQRTPQQTTAQPVGPQKAPQQSNDDVIEISSTGGRPNQAQASQPGQLQMPQIPNLSPEQLAKLPEAARKAYQERLQKESLRKAQGQANAPTTQTATNGQVSSQQMPQMSERNQELAQKINVMMAEVQRANPKGPAVSYDPASMEKARQSLVRLHKPLEAMSKTYLFAMTCGLEQRLREVIRAKVIVNQNVSDEHGTMKDYYSVSLEQLREMEKTVHSYMNELKNMQIARTQAPAPGQAPNAMKPQQPPAPPMATSTSQQGHGRKASASVKAPPAPIENKPFDWTHPSPQGVPKYGQNQLTPDKLKFPPQKRRKTGQPDSQASTPAAHAATPAAAGASPALVNGRIQSPEQLKRTQHQAKLEAEKEAQAKKFLCKDASCEASLQGFDTEAQLTQHVQAQHQPIDDPLGFFLSNAAASLDVDLEGKPLQKPGSTFTKPPPASQRQRATVKDLTKDELTKQEMDQIAKGIISSSVKDKLAKKQAEMDAAAKKAEEPAKEPSMLEAIAQKLDILLPANDAATAGADAADDFINWGPLDLGLNAMGLPGDDFSQLTDDFGQGTWVPVNPGMDPQDLVFQLMQEPPLESDTSPGLTPSEGSQSSRASDVSQSDAMRFKIMVENEAADLWGTGEPGLVAKSMIPMYDRINNMLNDGDDVTMGGVESEKEGGSPRKRKVDEIWDMPLGDYMDDFWNGGIQP